MRKIILILAIAILGSPIALLASQYGTIKGKVVDEKGEPANGASVVVVKTTKGMKVKKDGTYLISGITAGTYDIEARMVGKKTVVHRNINIVADETRTLDFAFADDQAARGAEVLVVGENIDTKQINKDRVGTGAVLTNKDLVATSREGMSFIGLTAGVFNESSGFIMRGARPNESQIRINGMNVSNSFTGGFGLGGMTYTATTSNFATEQTSVLTGGLPAEYGGVLGGIVNSTIRRGSKDNYEGYLRYKTDFEPLYGSQKNGMRIEQKGNENVIVNTSDGKKLQASGEQRFEFGIGGPIPGLNNCTFFISGWNLYEKNRSASYEIYDPAGNNLGLTPNDESWVKNLSGRLFFEFSDFSIDVGGSFGLQNFEALSDSWAYATNQGFKLNSTDLNGVPEYVAKERVWNTLTATAYVRLRHTLSPATYYELTISNTTNNDDVSKRKTYKDPDFLSGFDMWYPQDEYSAAPASNGDELKKGSNHIIDAYEILYRSDSTKDHFLKTSLPYANPLTGYVEGSPDATATNNPYGLSGYFYNMGNTGVFQFRRSNYWQVDGFLEHNVDGSASGAPSHNFKTGFEVQLYKLSLHSNSSPWSGKPNYDVYTSDWGGDLYTESAAAKSKSSQSFKPMRGAFYVQDRITYKGIVFTPGIRLDIADPNSDYRTSYYTFTPISSDTGFAKAKTKVTVSPRIAVAYPITDNSNIKLSYGLYYMMPDFQNFYDGFNTDLLASGSILGNPNMKAQKVNQYNISYEVQMSQLYAMTISAYYNDKYNVIGSKFVEATPTPFYQYTLSEYGNQRGLEFSLNKMATATDHFGFFVNYTLSNSIATSWSAEANASLYGTDPYTNKAQFAIVELTQPWDRTHRINGSLDLVWFQHQGPILFDYHVLENVRINLSGYFQTGTPYSKRDKKGKIVGELLSERQPSRWNVDLRFTKGFNLQGWFGVKASLDFFVDVTNLLNNRTYASVYAITGDPDNNGSTLLTTESNAVGTANYHRTAYYGNSTTFAANQYDNAGNRLYNSITDYDKNGVATPAERYKSFVRYLEDVLSFRSNYIYPRMVSLGFMVRF